MRYLIIEGHCGHDPDIRYSQSGTAVLKMRVATKEREKKDGEWQDVTQWISVTAFGGRAEGLAKILAKGTRVLARGKLDVHEFEKRDGSTGYDVGIVADDLTPLGRGKAQSDDQPADPGPSDYEKSAAEQFGEGDESDPIPF